MVLKKLISHEKHINKKIQEDCYEKKSIISSIGDLFTDRGNGGRMREEGRGAEPEK